MDRVPVSTSFVRMCQTIHLEDTLVNRATNESHIRLGNLLKFMDICACLSIESLSKASCVTASMDHLVFANEAIMPGESISIEASVVRCFNSSAEVVCRVILDPDLSLHTGGDDVRCLASAYFVFVRQDRGKMKQVYPETKKEIQAFELAMERRKARQYRPSSAVASQEGDHDMIVEGLKYDETLLPPVAAHSSLLEFTHIVLPPHANHMGNTFGGQILQWAENSAVMSATMHVNSSKRGNNNTFYYFDNSNGLITEEPGKSLLTSNPILLLSTVYVNGMSFVRPSSVGDRISFRSQVCRTFGSVIEVEVVVTASDVSQCETRHINTGYFLISCKEASSGRDLCVSPILPTTVEQKHRYNMSLKRMILASIRSSAGTNALENPLAMKKFSSQSNFVQLSSMLKMQESSIWNSDMPSSLTLSPLFEVECATELSLQDASSIVTTLSSSDNWDHIPTKINGTALHIRHRGKGENIVLVKFTVEISATLDNVVAYILDLSKRCEWDTILHTCHVIKSVVENEIDIVYMATPASNDHIGVDYCLLRCRRTLQDGRVVISSRSIVCEDYCQRNSTHRRGELLPSGFLLTNMEKVNEHKVIEISAVPCVRMDYILQLDETSAEMLSDDIKGESPRLLTSMSRLKDILENKITPIVNNTVE